LLYLSRQAVEYARSYQSVILEIYIYTVCKENGAILELSPCFIDTLISTQIFSWDGDYRLWSAMAMGVV